MDMVIKDKWKRFAVEMHVSSCKAEVEFFNELNLVDADDLENLYDKYEVTVWEPLQYMELDELSDQICNMAYMLQRTENEE